jgi:RNA polymerase sigma factor (sigma-70 family)
VLLITTDKAGRFHVEGRVPGMRYMVMWPKKATASVFVVVEPGKNKDLGDLKVDNWGHGIGKWSTGRGAMEKMPLRLAVETALYSRRIELSSREATSMSSEPVGPLLRYIRRLATGRKDSELPDNQLLERFANHQDESAFAALQRRHGPMVLSVCQSALHNWHDAEDVFQAVFLVLAQKAGSIQRREAVSSWLYGVAYRLALKAHASAARRKIREKRAAVMPSADPLLDLNLRELRSVLYQELDRLPEHYRSPLVLCYFEEKSQEEAARLLGWSKGSVIGRLQRGRELLRKRLRQRGLVLSSSLLVSALGLSSATVPILDAHRLAGWLADLESDQYTTRQQATEELEKLGEAVELALRSALENRPPLESRCRIRWLLDRLRAERLSPPPERLRTMRAVEVLERIGTSQARQLLDLLARGAPDVALTIEAKCALDRLSRRSE